jgi:hypothetical protein
MPDVTAKRGRPALVASARAASLVRVSFAAAWVGLGVAGVSAVAAAAIYLPLPQGRTVVAPQLRLSIGPELQVPTDLDAAQNWRDEWMQRVGLGGIDLRGAQDNVWKPHGGMSTLMATRFPSAGHVRMPDVEAAIPLPLPRPDSTERPNVVRTAPVVIEPQLASLPPQPKSDPGIFDKLFGDPDRAAKAVLAANPNAALYDIAKRAVYLPGGEKLEAHSGFREKPFHGVRALRMKPVGNGNMYNRDGILAHSYLLGEAGGSNGCISVRDYDKFLQAYEEGKFNQIIVLRSADEPGPAQVASNQADGT